MHGTFAIDDGTILWSVLIDIQMQFTYTPSSKKESLIKRRRTNTQRTGKNSKGIHNSMEIFKANSGMSYLDITDIEPIKLKNNKVISLFTGSGGLDIGLDQAGFETAVCVEIDSDCRETLRFNRPDWKIFENGNNRAPGDIRKISPEELLKFANLKKGEVAIVAGGAPCQPFSNIGKKNGKDDSENGDLFLEFVRIVKGINPEAFLFENVTGITQKKHSEVIVYITERLKDSGYHLSYTILDAANYGVAQRRERFFLLGFKNINNPAFPLPTNIKDIKTWNQLLTTLNKKPNYEPPEWITLGKILKKIPKESKSRTDNIVMNISSIVKERMEYIPPGKNFKVLPMNMRPDCWKSGKHQGQDTFGRLKLDEPSVTVRTAAYNPSKGKYIHPTENRGLNTIEMATIQGFPYHWKFKCFNREKPTLVSLGRQIGNAVPPPLAKAIGLAINIQLAEADKTRKLTRSENMARIKAKDTSIELILRRELWKRGYRYSKNDKTVFGKPDITFKSKKIAIFCDADFWHGHDLLKGKIPKTNTEFWKNKLLKNIKRDKEVNVKLKKTGWTVIRLSTSQIKRNINSCIKKIETALKGT